MIEAIKDPENPLVIVGDERVAGWESHIRDRQEAPVIPIDILE
jgi:hypothetical protein